MILDVPQFLTLRSQLPLVDVRSESEFTAGHIPFAHNIPILNNEERTIVGTTYKKLGQREAINEGFRLVGPRLLQIVQESEKIGKEFIVHCWRGGMRSANYCQFVGMAGIKSHQLKGGYKAYRQYAYDFFKMPFQFIVVSGFTGSGKSELLRELQRAGEQVVDLEALASHKGSAFGGIGLPPQPTTEQFQNNLFEVLNAFDLNRRIWIEDESIAVGKIFLPADIWTTMGRSPVVEVNVPKHIRVLRLVEEYGNVDREAFGKALKAITKKLGGQHYNTAAEKLLAGDMASAIEIILSYYDKAYFNGLSRRRDRIKLILPWDGLDVKAFTLELMQKADEIGAAAQSAY